MRELAAGSSNTHIVLEGNMGCRGNILAALVLAGLLFPHSAQALTMEPPLPGDCAEAEKEGVENYPLYKWTKATIDDPVKKAKYQKLFTCYVEGAEVYAKDKAEALEADLLPLVGAGLVEKLDKYDTNPANNPQPPAHLR